MPQNALMEKTTAAAALKLIRESLGLTIDDMATRLDMPTGSYRHYEERIKKSYQPADFIEKMIEAIPDHPEAHAKLRALTGPLGLAEAANTYGAQARGLRLLDAVSGGQSSKTTETPDFMVGSDGERIQIVATVDKAGIDKLIRRLQIMKEMLD